MIKVWRYNHYDHNTRTVDPAETWKTPEIVQETQPDSDYYEVTEIEDLYNLPMSYYSDEYQWRTKITDACEAKGWTNLTDEEKDISIELSADDSILNDTTTPTLNEAKVGHLMAGGMTAGEAVYTLTHNGASRHVLEVESCVNRAKDVYLYETIFTYLSLEEGGQLFNLLKGLFEQYTSQAIIGTNYGLPIVGIADFMENTVGTIYENAGFSAQGFTMLTGTESEFTNKVIQWLAYGNKI